MHRLHPATGHRRLVSFCMFGRLTPLNAAAVSWLLSVVIVLTNLLLITLLFSTPRLRRQRQVRPEHPPCQLPRTRNGYGGHVVSAKLLKTLKHNNILATALFLHYGDKWHHDRPINTEAQCV